MTDTPSINIPETWKGYEDEVLSTIETGERFCEDFDALLHKLEPVLPVPASKQDVSDAREKLLKEFEELMETSRTRGYQICDEIDLLSDKIGALMMEALMMEARLSLDQDMGDATDSIMKLEEVIVSAIRSADSRFLQSVYHRMMEGQETELQDWFGKEYLDEFSEHLGMRSYDRQAAELRENIQRPSSSRYIPSEIISLIYSFSDLETCVVTRQISSHWYSVFTAEEFLWKTKMKQRNPLMMPGNGDLQSWQDCVLVFVARVQNEKWKTFSSIEDIGTITPDTKFPNPTTVVARHLKKGQLLPRNFVSLTASSMTKSLRENVSLTEQQGKGINPWTGDIVDISTGHEIVSSHSEEMLVKYNGVAFTLPASTAIRGVQTNRTTIIVQTSISHTYFMSRENPHYSHALIRHRPGTAYLVGDDIVLFGINDQDDRIRTFFLVDIEDKQFHRICQHSTTWMPSACYNGVLWWYWYDSLHEREVLNSLTPTFVDLEQEPQKQYYHQEKTMRGLCQSIRNRQGSRSRDSAHFQILDNLPNGYLIVDLVTGDRTMVTGPYGLRYTSGLFMGFREGKFEAWWVDDTYGQID